MKIVFSGGGTLGSVSPLIAIYQDLKKIQPAADFLWLATRNGPEGQMIQSSQIQIKKIFAGKLRRYFNWQNFFDPIFVTFGLIQSIFILFKFKPDLVIVAGGFVGVPVVWAAWLLRRPILVHQQDVIVGLANKLMAPFAKIITVTFESSLKDFPPKKTKLIGNPVRAEVLSGNRENALNQFNLKNNLPTILIIGGGTGALNLNQLVLDKIEELVQFCQIIHLTGNKINKEFSHPNYHPYDFLHEELKDAYAISDLAVSRGGMSVLTELAANKLPVIIMPMAKSHQEANAQEFKRNNAALVISENKINAEDFLEIVKKVLFDQNLLMNFSRNIGKMMINNANQKMIALIYEHAGK